MTATVTLWVPLDASGDLTSGVESVLGDAEGVTAPAVYDIDAVAPRSTDIRVTAVVGLEIVVPDDGTRESTTRERIADAVGVMSIDRIEIE